MASDKPLSALEPKIFGLIRSYLPNSTCFLISETKDSWSADPAPAEEELAVFRIFNPDSHYFRYSHNMVIKSPLASLPVQA